MMKIPSVNDFFLAVMASFIGFGLALGVAQAVFDLGGGRSLFTANPVLAQTQTQGVVSCPDGYQLRTSDNYAAGTGYCVQITPAAIYSRENAASSTLNKKYLDPQCVITALNARESALIAGLNTYNDAILAALNARMASLMAAWRLPERQGRKTAIRQAWSVFRKSAQTATRNLNIVKKDVWTKYYTDRKACGIYATSDDTTSRYVDSAL